MEGTVERLRELEADNNIRHNRERDKQQTNRTAPQGPWDYKTESNRESREEK